MFSHLTCFVTTFAAVLAAYLVYSVAAVPFIEPSVEERESLASDSNNFSDSSADEFREHRLRSLFAPGSWELDNPTVVETDNGMLLIKDYAPLDDGCLELKPCTMILNTSSDKGDEGKKGRCVVLQAPEGAILKSDEPMNLPQGQIGRLQGGILNGPVTIHSPESRLGAGDHFQVRTRDVQITHDRILAPHKLDFRYGKNYGSGQDLVITMASTDGEDNEAEGRGKLEFGKLKSFELVQVDEIHLQIDEPDDIGQTDRRTNKEKPKPPAEVVVTCKGPFKYDFERQVATFERDVDLVRLNPDAPSDRLSCQWLAIHFYSPNDKPSSDPGKNSKLPDLSSLKMERIEARGSPAVLRAPSYSATARGEVLEYDFRTRRIWIQDSNKVMLRHEQDQIDARNLEYRLGDGGRLGTLRAQGPGVIRGALPDDPGKTFEAMWNDQLIMQPDQGDHAISLISGAVVRYFGVGEFAANKIHLWLHEVPRPMTESGKPRFGYHPVRILAERDVKIDSWQLTGQTQKAEVWIRYEDDMTRTAGGHDGGRSAPVSQPNGGQFTPGELITSSQDANGSKQKFAVECQGVQLQLVRQGKRMAVERLIIDGGVQLREVRTTKPGEAPIEIKGDIVQVDHAKGDHARVHVKGTDAVVSARGLTIHGDDIQLRRGENRMEVAGPGSLVLPARKSSAPERQGYRPPQMPASPMTISWKGHMEFGGRTAKFVGDVHVRGVQSTRDGETLDLLVMGHELHATLNHSVDFSKTKQDPDLDIQELAFRGSVFLQNKTSQHRRQTSFDQMQVRDLSIDRASGRLHANGPGWGSSVRFRDKLPSGEPASPEAVGESNDSELVYVYIHFKDELVGNIDHREMEFRGLVETVYGPVAAWDQTLDPDPPDGPGDDVFLLTSDRLALAQVGPRADDGKAPIELMAYGDATIEGKGFTARGWRISYARAKDMLILEGDGRNDAKLWLKGSTTPDAAARQIRVWPHNNRYHIDDGSMLELSQIGLGKRV